MPRYAKKDGTGCVASDRAATGNADSDLNKVIIDMKPNTKGKTWKVPDGIHPPENFKKFLEYIEKTFNPVIVAAMRRDHTDTIDTTLRPKLEKGFSALSKLDLDPVAAGTTEEE